MDLPVVGHSHPLSQSAAGLCCLANRSMSRSLSQDRHSDLLHHLPAIVDPVLLVTALLVLLVPLVLLAHQAHQAHQVPLADTVMEQDSHLEDRPAHHLQVPLPLLVDLLLLLLALLHHTTIITTTQVLTMSDQAS